jgi:histidinol phosphatase-like PHP family hydrolase
MKEVVKKGNDLGYEYLALTEHNPSQKGHNDQQIIDILKRKQIVVEQLNYSLKNENTKSVRKVFNSLEIDMKSDGSLPVPDAGLSILDFALVSIHSNFDLPRDLQTNGFFQLFLIRKLEYLLILQEEN